ncbi:MAG: hypothetical protein LBQ89_08250 [Treponema sp.]|jgi:hypothetical protein|nr:hypothetical protein [Treponema sp.]
MKKLFFLTIFSFFCYIIFAQNSNSGFGPFAWGASIEDLYGRFENIKELNSNWERVRMFNVPINYEMSQEYWYFDNKLFQGYQKYYPISSSDSLALARSITNQYGLFDERNVTMFSFWRSNNFYRYYRRDLTIVARIIESNPGNFLVCFFNPIIAQQIKSIYSNFNIEGIEN